MTAITSQTFHAAELPAISRGLRQGAAWLIRAIFSPSAAPAASSAQESRQREASKLHRYAQRFEQSDPGFASDLHAAANRHELAD